MYSYSCASWGTTDETIAPSTSFSDSPRRPSTPDITTAIWSPVASRTVAKRQCSTRSSLRNIPTCVCVFPTSTAISMARDYVLHGQRRLRRPPVQGLLAGAHAPPREPPAVERDLPQLAGWSGHRGRRRRGRRALLDRAGRRAARGAGDRGRALGEDARRGAGRARARARRVPRGARR